MKKANKLIMYILLVLLITIFLLMLTFPLTSTKLLKTDRYMYRHEIKVGEQYTTKFEILDNKVEFLQFYVNSESTNGSAFSDNELIVSIFDTKDNLIYKNTFETISTSHNEIMLKKNIINEKGKEYKISFELKKATDTVKILRSSSDNAAVDQIVTINDYSFVYWMLVIIICYFIFINYKTSKRIIKKIKLSYFIYHITSLIFSTLFLYLIYQIGYKDKVSTSVGFVILVLAFIICKIGFNLWMRETKLEKKFLIIAIPIISIMLAVIMPGDSYDEYVHYSQAYAISQGNITETGTYEVPDVILTSKGPKNVEHLFKILKNEYSYNSTKSIGRCNYNPIYYIISSIGLLIGRLFNLNPYIGWYIAKYLNSIAYLIISYFIIKIMPKHKLATTIFLLSPMILYQSVSITTDEYINLSTIMLLAFSLRKFYTQEKMTMLDIIIVFILSIFSLTAKYVYFPIIICCYLLMKKSIKATNKGIIKIIILTAAIITFCYLSKILLSESVLPINDTTSIVGDSRLVYSIKNITRTFTSVFKYFIENCDIWIFNSIGYSFTWGLGIIPILYPALILISIIAALVGNNQYEQKKLKLQKLKLENIISFLIAFFICFGFIFMGLYIFEYRSKPLINYGYGIQGRYFIPINFLLLLIVGNYKLINKNVEKFCFTLYCISFILYLNYFILFLY